MKKTIFLIALATALFSSGCVATQVEKLRKKIPAGHADTLKASVTTVGGWGGSITGKNIESDGKGHLSADEYSESINSPWATYQVDLTGTSIGKKRVVVKPAEETETPKIP